MFQWFLNLSLSRKQTLVMLVSGLIPLVLVDLISLSVAGSSIERQVFSQLESVRDNKAEAVRRYFEGVEKHVVTLASGTDIRRAMSSLSHAFSRISQSEGVEDAELQAYKEQLEEYYTNEFSERYQSENEGKTIDIGALMASLDKEALVAQYFYIAENEHPLGEKHQLDAAVGASRYHTLHRAFHPGIRQFLEAFGYYDIFLVDIKSGDVVYSVFKELDFGTSLISGPYKETNFAEAFKSARELDVGETVLIDYAQYPPSYEAAASFIATPIFDREEAVGVLVFQMPVEPINQIMSERSGMGDTGETYLVGPDYLMRSDSFLDPDHRTVKASFASPAQGAVKTGATVRGINGVTDTKVMPSYQGVNVLSAFSQILVGKNAWAIVSEIHTDEAFSAVTSLRITILLIALGIVVVLVFFAVVISRVVSAPIIQLSDAIIRVGEQGDFSVSIKNKNKDEVGRTSRALNDLLKNLSEAILSTNGVLENMGKGQFDKKVSTDFAGQLGQLAQGVNSANTLVESSKMAQQKQAEAAEASAEQAQKMAENADRQARQALIVKQALDVSATSAFITNESHNIVYRNNSMMRMLGSLEKNIQKVITGFNVSDVIDTDISPFLSDPDAQKSQLREGSGTFGYDLSMGELEFTISATPIRDEKNIYLGAVIEVIDMTEILARQLQERCIFEENARIRQALDTSSTSTMIADPNFNIIYTNRSLNSMMQNAQRDLQEYMGEFDATNLLGQNMDVFHKDPSHQRRVLSELSQTYSNQVKAGNRTFSIIANPILDHEGKRIGTVVEWADRTAEVAIETEIDNIIDAASGGDFSATLDIANKEGFFLSVSESLNRLLKTTNIALADVIRVFSALASGDLTQKITREYTGEFARLKEDANTTVEKLQQVIEEIYEGSSTISRAAQEISSGNVDLSQRTEEQASSLEETAASMEQMTRIVQSSEQETQAAFSASQGSIAIAREGNDSVQGITQSMKEISESSEKISNIISVIDEIAFQTNLLALNAAVEAARAGDQGRGFAVVAGEVRQLAQRSASAAKEIKILIQDSVQKVSGGSKLVEASGATLSTIVSEIEKVGEIMDGILTSAKEQSLGIKQVSSAISQMDQITQQNAALVEEATAASENMADQARRLDSVVGFFKR